MKNYKYKIDQKQLTMLLKVNSTGESILPDFQAYLIQEAVKCFYSLKNGFNSGVAKSKNKCFDILKQFDLLVEVEIDPFKEKIKDILNHYDNDFYNLSDEYKMAFSTAVNSTHDLIKDLCTESTEKKEDAKLEMLKEFLKENDIDKTCLSKI